ncbi:MAG: 2-dehydropantoate 2-reductase [Anaerolineae bacterium]
MRIAIFGTGGVGGYFGGLLAHAGHDVTFIARGAHLQAIREKGLEVRSVHGDFTVHPAQATARPSEVGLVDYVIVAVKHYHLAEAAPMVRHLVGPNTVVAPLLNGVDAHEYLIEVLGNEPVIGGLCALVSMIEAPGIIRQTSRLRRVELGELDGNQSERVERLIRAWSEGGVESIHSDSIHIALWNKLLFIASFGGVTALARANAGEILSTPQTRTLFIQAMREIEAVARSQGTSLPSDAVERGLGLAEAVAPEGTSSMQRDVAAGRPFELEAFSGKIVQLGEASGVETPVHRGIYSLLKPALDRAT